MAALMYDWRIPENDEEVDTEMEIPDSLMKAMVALEKTYIGRPSVSNGNKDAGVKQAGMMYEGRPWLPGACTSRPSSSNSLPSSRPGTAGSVIMKTALPAALQGAPKVADIAAAQFHLPEQVQ
jgi:hypothetical protein